MSNFWGAYQFEDDTHFYAKPQRAVRKKGPPEEIKAQIRAMRKSGAKYSDICEVTGASSTAVHKVLKESGMVRGYGQIYKKTLRVTDSERARIRKLYDKGLTQHKVAAMTGRSIPTVRKVLREYGEE